jgi:hypothetical protein
VPSHVLDPPPSRNAPLLACMTGTAERDEVARVKGKVWVDEHRHDVMHLEALRRSAPHAATITLARLLRQALPSIGLGDRVVRDTLG